MTSKNSKPNSKPNIKTLVNAKTTAKLTEPKARRTPRKLKPASVALLDALEKHLGGLAEEAVTSENPLRKHRLSEAVTRAKRLKNTLTAASKADK